MAELAQKETAENLTRKLTEIAESDIPEFDKVCAAYQMGRDDLARELENN
jgi:hypothetical protein